MNRYNNNNITKLIQTAKTIPGDVLNILSLIPNGICLKSQCTNQHDYSCAFCTNYAPLSMPVK